jgi:hypothetical protein
MEGGRAAGGGGGRNLASGRGLSILVGHSDGGMVTRYNSLSIQI